MLRILICDSFASLGTLLSPHPLNNLGKQLYPGLGLPLHVKNNPLGKKFIVHELFLPKIEAGRPLQVVERLVEVFLLDLDFRNFIQRRAGKKVVLRDAQNLFEVDQRVTHVVHFLQSLRFVEVSLTQRG